MVKVDEGISFVRFVYPFLFEPQTFLGRAAVAARAEWPRPDDPALAVWERERFPEDDLLRHVALYLNPPDDTPPTARLWELTHDALDSASGGLGGRAGWRLTYPRGEVPFNLVSAQLALFRVGVGFLTVGTCPQTAALDDWLDFVHFFRFLSGQRGVGVRAERRTGRDQTAPFFPAPAGSTATATQGRDFGEVVDALLRTAALPEEVEPWWREVFVPGQALPYAALAVEGLPADELPRRLYQVRNFFHARQPLHPGSADLRLDDQPGLLPYAEGQWFVFSLGGGAFVGSDLPAAPFFRQTLPEHVGRTYYLLFLLALHQRFALMMLSEEVARCWVVGSTPSAEEQREACFARIRDTMLAFTARGHFVQVMQQEHHPACYRRWQETFQVDRLYREVGDEVGEMSQYVLMRRSEQLAAAERAVDERVRRLEWRLSLIATLLGVPAVALTYLGTISLVPWWVGLLVGAGGLAIGGLLLAGLHRSTGRG